MLADRETDMTVLSETMGFSFAEMETIIMERTIKNLRSKFDGKLYVKCESADTQSRFIENATKEGYTFGGHIAPHRSQNNYILAVEKDNTLSHLGLVGMIAFQAGECVRVDYQKYIDGEDDYIF